MGGRRGPKVLPQIRNPRVRHAYRINYARRRAEDLNKRIYHYLNFIVPSRVKPDFLTTLPVSLRSLVIDRFMPRQNILAVENALNVETMR